MTGAKKAVALFFMMLFEQVSRITKKNKEKRSHDKPQPLRPHWRGVLERDLQLIVVCEGKKKKYVRT